MDAATRHDHHGASRGACERRGIPLWCGEGDAEAAENPLLIRKRQPRHPLNRVISDPAKRVRFAAALAR